MAPHLLPDSRRDGGGGDDARCSGRTESVMKSKNALTAVAAALLLTGPAGARPAGAIPAAGVSTASLADASAGRGPASGGGRPSAAPGGRPAGSPGAGAGRGTGARTAQPPAARVAPRPDSRAGQAQAPAVAPRQGRSPAPPPSPERAAAPGGRGHHGGHDGRGDHEHRGHKRHRHDTAVVLGFGAAFGPSWWWWGTGYPYWWRDYPDYGFYAPGWYGAPAGPVTAEPAPVYVQRASAGYWYYCPSSRAYYPTVASCAEPWIAVPPRPQTG